MCDGDLDTPLTDVQLCAHNTGSAPTNHYEGHIQLPSWMINYDGAADKFVLRSGDTVFIDIDNDFSTMDEFC